MKQSIRYPIAIIAGLLIAAPAFAQTQGQTPNHPSGTSPKAAQSTSGMNKQNGQGSASAKKQKTEGDITEVGPGSKAYYGNTLHSKY